MFKNKLALLALSMGNAGESYTLSQDFSDSEIINVVSGVVVAVLVGVLLTSKKVSKKLSAWTVLIIGLLLTAIVVLITTYLSDSIKVIDHADKHIEVKVANEHVTIDTEKNGPQIKDVNKVAEELSNYSMNVKGGDGKVVKSFFDVNDCVIDRNYAVISIAGSVVFVPTIVTSSIIAYKK
jgi:hypothetical protein